MNQHQHILAEMARQYEAIHEADIVGPGALAQRVYAEFAEGDEEPHIQYTSLEHMKHMARRFLANRHDADGDDNPSHGAQGEFQGIGWSGQLQPRYPLPRQPGQEPAYKRRELLTDEERAFNVAQLRKSAKARQEHADALEAEGQMRGAA